MSALHTQIGISSDCLVVLSFMTLLVWAAPVGAETQVWFTQDNYGCFL